MPELTKRFDDVAPDYERIVKEEAGYSAYVRVPERIVELLRPKAKASVLDLACGTGLSSLAFFEAGFDVTGVDFAPGMIEIAKQRPFRRLICQSIEEDLDVPDASFDAVVALGVIEFIKKPARLLNQIASKLKVGGVCGVTVPKKSASAEKKLRIRTYTKDNFLKLIDRRSCELLEVESFFGYTKLGQKVQYSAFFLRKVG